MIARFTQGILLLATVTVLGACSDSANSSKLPGHAGSQTSKQVSEATGAGSSFVYPLMSKWSAAFAERTGHHVNYQSIGSSGGIAQIKAGTVDFGASDKPMSSADLAQHGLGQFPIVIGGIVPIYHLESIASGKLVLDGATLAAIFLGKIDRWNDPAIAALNPELALPNQPIRVVHRSDGSGTTFNFTDYLSATSSGWKQRVGTGTAVDWPTGIGGKGNEGVAAYVKQLDNTIGYVEYAYALRNGISHARMMNAAGKVVSPDTTSFQAAAATADWASAEDFNLLMTNAPGANAWPITATTWVIMHKTPRDKETAAALFDFFRYAFAEGADAAAELHYVPLPDALIKRIEAYWASKFPASGQ